jgi:hypothetical protein
MRWGVVAVLLAALLVLPGMAGAQYLTFDAERRGQAVSEARPSLRLDAMGGLYLVIPDENNELNLSDFGGNLAGVLSDRRGWSVESWLGRNNTFVDLNTAYHGRDVRQRNRLDLEGGGLDVVYRREAKRALGMTLFWRGYDARLTYGPNSRVSGPNSRFFVNQVLGPLTAAVGVATASDKEDLVSSDIFAIRHTSESRRLTVAAVWDLRLAGMSVGAQLDADRVRIDGADADPSGFHGDSFAWRRPATQMRLTLVRPEGLSPLAFGVNVGRLRREGTEEATISWSNRFPSNPSRVNYANRVPSFTETEHGWDAGGRASWRFARHLQLSGEGLYRKLDSRVTEAANSNFAGSRSQENAKLTTWRFGAGLGAVLLRDGRLRAGVETAVDGGQLDSARPRQSLVQETRGYEARTGAEYLFARNLVVRAGYQWRSHDYAVGEPASLGLSHGLSLGFGYVPRGGLVAFDTFLRVWREYSDVPGAADREAAARDLAISARFLF